MPARPDRRRSPRAAVWLRATLRFGDLEERAYAGEIGLRGAFFASPSPRPARQLLSLSLVLPDGAELALSGMVVRAVSAGEAGRRAMPPGMAVQFYGMSKPAREQWERVFFRVLTGRMPRTSPPLSSSPARRQGMSPNPPALVIVPEEEDPFRPCRPRPPSAAAEPSPLLREPAFVSSPDPQSPGDARRPPPPQDLREPAFVSAGAETEPVAPEIQDRAAAAVELVVRAPRAGRVEPPPRPEPLEELGESGDDTPWGTWYEYFHGDEGRERAAGRAEERPPPRDTEGAEAPDAVVGPVLYRLPLPSVIALRGFADTALRARGIFVRNVEPRPAGTPAVVCVVHPLSGDEVHLSGEVVELPGPGPGVAVAFLGVTARTLADFETFIVRGGAPQLEASPAATVESSEPPTLSHVARSAAPPGGDAASLENAHDVHPSELMVLTATTRRHGPAAEEVEELSVADLFDVEDP